MDYKLPYYLRRSISRLSLRVIKKLPSCVIIDGGLGSGKTTLAVQVLEHYQGSKIDYASQYAMGGRDFVKKILLCYQEKRKVIIYDEAGDYNKRTSGSEFNQAINEVFEKFRAFKILIIICLPHFDDLDSRLFKKKIPRLLINVNRSVNDDFATIKGFGAKRIAELRYLLRKDKVRNPALVYFSYEPNWGGKKTGRVKVFDMPIDRSLELDKISTESKVGDVIKIGSRLDDFNKSLVAERKVEVDTLVDSFVN